MLIQEILKIESANTESIHLFKEGIFWRMYQNSAYRFTQRMKELKVLKKFFKNVNSEVVYVGFPGAILHRIEALSQSNSFKFEKHNEKYCVISGFEPDNGFEEWFQSIPLFQKINDNDAIIQKIKEYPVVDKTPLETVQFVAELQTSLTRIALIK